MNNDLKARCDAIEECYEFMLAYAAQGVVDEASSQASGQLRSFFARAEGALTGLGDAYRAVVDHEQVEHADRYRAFIDVLDRDAHSALAAFQLVIAQPSISSQIVDNLNASIHVRALLTDLFLIDEIFEHRERTEGQRSKVKGEVKGLDR
jgi:hypothetical protein